MKYIIACKFNKNSDQVLEARYIEENDQPILSTDSDIYWEDYTHWNTLSRVKFIASEVTRLYNRVFIPVSIYDTTQFTILAAPKLGDNVFYIIDSIRIEDGFITKISKTFRTITSSTGKKYWRIDNTSFWKESVTGGIFVFANLL